MTLLRERADAHMRANLRSCGPHGGCGLPHMRENASAPEHRCQSQCGDCGVLCCTHDLSLRSRFGSRFLPWEVGGCSVSAALRKPVATLPRFAALADRLGLPARPAALLLLQHTDTDSQDMMALRRFWLPLLGPLVASPRCVWLVGCSKSMCLPQEASQADNASAGDSETPPSYHDMFHPSYGMLRLATLLFKLLAPACAAALERNGLSPNDNRTKTCNTGGAVWTAYMIALQRFVISMSGGDAVVTRRKHRAISHGSFMVERQARFG